jgi:UDP-glucose 4-epimerase
MSNAGDLFGEMHLVETHLIPNIINKQKVTIFGNDWPTPDGTCIRDYVHVTDLADAIKKALSVTPTSGHKIYNLGSGKGTSVLQVANEANRILNNSVEISFDNRRPGDPSELVSDPEKAERDLGWKPKLNLETMLKDAIIFFRYTIQQNNENKVN